MKTELELRQMFKNFSDCYADTWIDIGIEMKQGNVIQALTEEKFIEMMKQANFISSNSVLSEKVCGKCEMLSRDGFPDQCDEHSTRR